MSKISKKNNIPKIIELSEKEIKERTNYFRDSLKDEDGLIDAIKKNLKKKLHKDEFKKNN